MNSATSLQVMDLTSLRAVLADLRQQIIPSRFEIAQQPDSQTIQIGLRTLKGMNWLELSWLAYAPRLVQISTPSRQGSESTLAQQIQHALNHMALVELKQKGFERIVEFGLSIRPGEPIQKTLVLELMGRHSNLLLLDQSRRVITLGRQIREHQSRKRPIATGDMYVPPPPMQGIAPSQQETLERWKKRLCLVPANLQKALQSNYQGISPSLALQIAGNDYQSARELLDMSVINITNKQWHALHERWRLWLNNLESENLVLVFTGPTPYRVWKAQSSTCKKEGTSLSLGNYYKSHLDSKKLTQISEELQKKLLKMSKVEQDSLITQQSLLATTYGSNSLQKQADQLLSMPSPKKSIIEKAQKLYLKAKKLRRSIPLIEGRIIYHEKRIEVIEEIQSFLDILTSHSWEDKEESSQVITHLTHELDELLLAQRKSKREKRHGHKNTKLRPLEIISPTGLVIQIGRNHRQNEWISLQKANKGDLWFHAQECPGSHVVLKSSAGLAEEEDLQVSADLAAFFSRAKENQKVPIVTTSTDQLKRVPGAAPGTVNHSKSRICWGEPSKGIDYIKNSIPKSPTI